MLIKKAKSKRRKLSVEILGFFILALFLSIGLLRGINEFALSVLVSDYESHGFIIPEEEFMKMDSRVFNVSLVISTVFFIVLFLTLAGQHLSYIIKITKGIEKLHNEDENFVIELEGNNELTELAEEINYLSEKRRLLKEKEKKLYEEKEEFIRVLSHDIRNPLTAITAYSQFLHDNEDVPKAEEKKYLEMIIKRAESIKELTDLLLEKDNRSVELFEDAFLLIEQLAFKFSSELEDYNVVTDISGCKHFSGRFDVLELQRIFDNLISNVRKYADPENEVSLIISASDKALSIIQSNKKSASPASSDSYRIGIHSIKKIAANYSGNVSVDEGDNTFSIKIVLSDI